MTKEVELERGIPIPSENELRRNRLHRKYPWDKMHVGDSFFVEDRGKSNTARSVVNLANARYEARFAAKKVEGGYRVWRVE